MNIDCQRVYQSTVPRPRDALRADGKGSEQAEERLNLNAVEQAEAMMANLPVMMCDVRVHCVHAKVT